MKLKQMIVQSLIVMPKVMAEIPLWLLYVIFFPLQLKKWIFNILFSPVRKKWMQTNPYAFFKMMKSTGDAMKSVEK